MTKEEVLENLKKEDIKNLDDLADLIAKKSNPSGAANQTTNSVIVYNHGFVTS